MGGIQGPWDIYNRDLREVLLEELTSYKLMVPVLPGTSIKPNSESRGQFPYVLSFLDSGPLESQSSFLGPGTPSPITQHTRSKRS